MSRYILIMFFLLGYTSVKSQDLYNKFDFDTSLTYKLKFDWQHIYKGKYQYKDSTKVYFKSINGELIEVPLIQIRKIDKYFIDIYDKPISQQRKGKRFFVYNNREQHVVWDISMGLGIMERGLQIGPALSLDIYHFFMGLQLNVNNYTILGATKNLGQRSWLFGYRYRGKRSMIALASGFGSQDYYCTSGTSGNCYGYKNKKISTTPLSLQADYIISDQIAIGINMNKMFSSLQDVSGIMLTMKLGNFKIYE